VEGGVAEFVAARLTIVALPAFDAFSNRNNPKLLKYVLVPAVALLANAIDAELTIVCNAPELFTIPDPRRENDVACGSVNV
jgi:hypothetical protein